MRPDLEAAIVAERLDAVVAQFMRDRAAAAKALRAATASPGTRRRPGIARMRALVQAAFEREPQLAAAFREGPATDRSGTFAPSTTTWVATGQDRRARRT